MAVRELDTLLSRDISSYDTALHYQPGHSYNETVVTDLSHKKRQ